jgi:hypothetical protein
MLSMSLLYVHLYRHTGNSRWPSKLVHAFICFRFCFTYVVYFLEGWTGPFFLCVKPVPTASHLRQSQHGFSPMFCNVRFASTRFSRETLGNQVILTRGRFSSVRYINLLGDYTSSALTSHFNLNQHSKPQQVNSKMRSLLILLCFVVLTIAFVGNDLFDGV